MSCCKEIEPLECAAGMLGIVQLGGQWLCFSLMYGHDILDTFITDR